MADLKNDIATSLLAGNFDRHTPNAKSLSDPIADTPMVLTLDELRAYEHNPRIMRNPLYDDIRISILQRGLDSPPAVTRRPGEEHYIIRNGGNTRLSILRELWSETKDERFFRIFCLYRPWQGEIVALTGHLAENELHGSLTFVEKALGVDKAREIYEQENSQSISQTDLAKRLTQDGFPCDQSQISRMQETIRLLLPAIPNALYGGLHTKHIRKLLKLRQSALLFWMENSGTADDQGFSDLFEEVLSQFDTEPAEFDFSRLQDELVGQLSSATNCSYDHVALDVLHSGSPSHKKEKAQPVNTEMPLPAAFPQSETQIPKDFVKPDLSDVMAEAKAHSSRFVIQAKETTDPQADTELPPPPTRNGLARPASEEAEKQIAAHTVSSTDTSERVHSIQRMVAAHVGEEINDFEDNVLKAVPVQAGGLYPISDVWYIEPAIDTPECLRTHIEQLAVEIADEAHGKDLIEQDEEGIGFTCRPDADHAVLILLGAISQSPAVCNEETQPLYDQLPQLLLGPDSEQRLSDEALVKLYRLIRLARRLMDLTVDKRPM